MINIVIINIVRFQVFIKGDVRPFLQVSATFYQDITLRTFSELWRTSYTLVLLGGRKRGAGGEKKKERRTCSFEVFHLLTFSSSEDPLSDKVLRGQYISFPWRPLIWRLFHHIPHSPFYSVLNLGKSWNLPLHWSINHDLIKKYPI